MGLEKSDDLGEVTNYANRWKLYHRKARILYHSNSYTQCFCLQ